jgi:uncharacterized membrane protein YbhN (UPF0104 family)
LFEKNRKLILAVLFAAVAGFLVYRLSRSDFAWPLFFAAFRGVNWWWLFPSIALIYMSHLGRAMRWELMLRPLRQGAKISGLFTATIIGFTAIVLLGRPGEFVRPYLISVREKVTFSSQMAAWLLERIFDLLMILLLFGYALVAVPADRLHLGTGLQWVFRTGGYFCAIICTLCVVVLFGFRGFSGSVRERLSSALSFLPERFRERTERLAASFGEGARSTASTRFLILLLGHSAFIWVTLVAAYFCLFRSIEATSSFRLDQVMIFMGLVAFGSAFQIPGIGGGFQIAAILVLREIFGLRLETATGLAVILWVAAFLPVVPIGLVLGFREGFNWRKIKMIQGGLNRTGDRL